MYGQYARTGQVDVNEVSDAVKCGMVVSGVGYAVITAMGLAVPYTG